MAKKHVNRPLWHPALWPSWLVVFILYLISRLSMPSKQRLGARIGRLAFRRMGGRRKVARKNLQACFPELDDNARDRLAEDTFVACAQGFTETLHAWWCDVQPQLDSLIITGGEHLKEAQSRGKGVFLLGGHFSIFDLALPFFAAQLNKPGYMYRPNDNPVVDRMIENGRRRHFNIQGFDKYHLKEMIGYMKDGGSVWYACDQDFGRRGSLFVSFFGVQTGCITTPSWIARESGASVLCVSQFRHSDGRFEIAFSPILDGFGEDERRDAEQWNHYLEQAIRRYPAQYLWLHKRFKTRPEGSAPIY